MVVEGSLLCGIQSLGGLDFPVCCSSHPDSLLRLRVLTPPSSPEAGFPAPIFDSWLHLVALTLWHGMTFVLVPVLLLTADAESGLIAG